MKIAKCGRLSYMQCMKLLPFLLLTWDFTYLQQCSSSDRNLIFHYFSRLIAIVAHTTAHVYAREEQIVAIRMIVLEDENGDAEQHLPHVVAWTAIFGGMLL